MTPNPIVVRAHDWGCPDCVTRLVEFDVYARFNDDYLLYSIPVAKMRDDEPDLTSKRWRLLSEEEQAYRVALPMSDMGAMETMIDWIGDHITVAWRFHIEMSHVEDGTVTFSFADLSSAAHFKLRFS